MVRSLADRTFQLRSPMDGFPPGTFTLTQQCNRFRMMPDTSYLLSASYRILGMQAGFGLIESSFTRKMNSANIMTKNIFDLVLSSMLYIAVGYGLAFGEPAFGSETGSLVGNPLRADKDYTMLLFQYSFAATTSTIDSGALAERVNFWAYLVTSSACCGILYPIVAHWGWMPEGWLAQLGFHDFAGGMIVHGFGGFFALASILHVGPRIGRFAEYTPRGGALNRLLFRPMFFLTPS